MRVPIGPCILQVAFSPSFMDYLKSIKQVPHSGKEFLAGVQSHMG